MEKNILGIDVTRPNDVLIVNRGVSGSGKSTSAKKMVGEGIIHSTDNVIESKGDYNKFFEQMNESKDYTLLMKAHSENNKNVKDSIDAGISPVILDNTNIKAKEPKEIVEYALNKGYANENIIFNEVGTAGLSAEELANRNTHGVSLEKIKGMIQSYKSVGPLTLEKVVNAKPMHKKKSKKFASVVLDDKSRGKLLAATAHYIPKGWEIIAHHMTINFGNGLGPDREEDLGKSVSLIATDIGISEMAVAVKVQGYPSDNDIPHVTLAINGVDGGKAVMSNYIEDWKSLTSNINLSGVVTEEKLR